MKGFGTLYVFELKKVLGQRLFLVSVLLGAALLFGWSLLTFYGTGYYYRYDAQTNSVEQLSRPYCEVEALRRDSMRALAGQELDEPLMEELIGQYRDDASGTRMWNLNSYSPILYLNIMEDRTDITAEGFYVTYLRTFNPVLIPLTAQEKIYWQEMASTLDPLILDYAGGWQAMAQNCGLLCQVTVLLTAVCLCRLFSQEHRARTDQLVLSSVRGKTAAFWARWAVGASFGAGLSLVFSGLYVLLYCVLYGPDGFSTALQLWSKGTSFPLHLSMGGFVLLLLALLVLACILTASLVMFLSELLRNAVPALAVPFLLSGLCLLDLFYGWGRVAEQISSYLPFFRISLATLQDFYLVTLGPLQFNALQFSFLLYALLILLCAGLCWCSYRRYQVTGR